jgi:hypothetical protein
MRLLLGLCLLVIVAGCMGQGSSDVKGGSDCSDVGCPVDLNVSEAPQSSNVAPNCGDGILESPEECDSGFPCKAGYCDKCRCLDISPESRVSDCAAACAGVGFFNGTTEVDGNCTYNMGSDTPEYVRCTYRKVFPSVDAGKVCCCRDLKYIKCPTADGKVACPKESEVMGLCQKYKPKGNSTA